MIISFSITRKLAEQHNVPDPLFTGQKTVTRRAWKECTGNTYIKQFEEGRIIHKAYSNGVYVKGVNKGKHIGNIHLTEKPYQERLGDMPFSDLYREGGFWKSQEDFIKLVAKGNENLIVWVVRFKFEKL